MVSTFSVNNWFSRTRAAFLVALVWTALPGSLEAALEADLVTSRGTVTIQLEYAKTPKAVASFLTLAQGSAWWVDARTGAVEDDPFFDGLSFFGGANTSTSKWIGSGSQDGSSSDSPGYTFQDEFNATLIHDPYVVGLASDGPNTNGSRFYLTGSVSMADLNNHNVVFGKIPSTPSRLIVDQIIAAGAGATTINSVVVRRTDAGAVAFNEDEVALPLVSPPGGVLQILPGNVAAYQLARTDSTVLQGRSSLNLQDWAPHFRSFSGLGETPGPVQLLESPIAARARFFNIALTSYPNAGGASSFANRVLTANTPGTGDIVYQFNAAGTGGSYVNTRIPDDPFPLTGPFTVRTDVPAHYDAYSFIILVQANNFGGAPLHLIRGGFDEIQPTKVIGRNRTRFMNSSMGLVFEDEGSLELSRP
ncbi:peptidylprolyl isomerase [Luteolibacter sp. Populi]|uniref:peptidylprolyl isomerase n=1 Tax=Luteolibacter sp. Populi TaxID=3230487 RepID=UPI003467BFE9